MKIPRKYRKSDKKLFKFLIENKDEIISDKKSKMKRADSSGLDCHTGKSIKKSALKNEVGFGLNENGKKKHVDVRVIINTTNLLDSHKDVHINDLWEDELKKNKKIIHVQEHKSNEFKKIISSGDDLEVYTKSYTWKELGFDYKGKTQALVFDSRVRKSRNKFMFKQYKKKFVDNHSVGMIYKDIVMCVNSEDYPEEYENFKKYSKYIVNKEDIGNYFFAVLKAGIIEGSAVPRGSNHITPTISVKNKSNNKKNKNKLISKWLNN